MKKLKPATRPADEPAAISLFIATAARALAEGKAVEHQQKEFVAWLVREACGNAYPPYHHTDRDTSFALGRRFVADQFHGLLTVNLDSLRRLENAGSK